MGLDGIGWEDLIEEKDEGADEERIVEHKKERR